MTICSICLEHLEQPVCCIPCGHLYCNQCISDWRNGHNNRCPECREPITTVQSIYLDTESIKDMSVENTRLNESINDLTATIENLRQSTSNEEQVNQLQTLNAVLLSDIDQKVLELGKIKDNFGRAAITCETLKLRNDLKTQELGKMKDNYERANGTCQVLQRQNYLKAQELGKMKDNYERANGTCQVLQRQNCELNLELKRTNIRKRSTPTDRGFRRMIFLIERGVLDSIMFIEDNNVARFASVIFLIFTSVCFLYLTGCIFTEWFSAKPEFLEDIVVRHLEFLSGGSAFIMSTFKTAASYVKYFIDTCIPACTNYIGMCTNMIAEKASAYFNADIQNLILIVYWACQVVYSVFVILFAFCRFAIAFFLLLFMSICLVFSYAVLISFYLFLYICIGSLFFLKTLLRFFLLR